MQYYQKICLSIFAFSMLVGTSSNANAQSKGFPAFSPDVETVESDKKTVSQPKTSGFPTFSTTDQAKPSQRSGFPVAKSNQQLNRAVKHLDFQQLGALLSKMSLDPEHFQRRYDVLYIAKIEEQEMELSLSVLLEKGDALVRVQAWLDPLPAGNISALPLLEMLSQNAEMNRGLRFAYSKQTGRFLLEKTIPNQNVTPELLTSVFQDVSSHVAANWGTWSTSQWDQVPQPTTQEPVAPTEVITRDRFEMPLRR